MKILKEITEENFYPAAPHIESTTFDRRISVRAVMIDENKSVALLRLNAFHAHKLPGGGIDKGEDAMQALERELMEETGCTAEIINELGKVIEYRDQSNLIQESYSYLVRQYNQKGTPSYSENERSQECELIWTKDINEAIQLIKKDVSSNYAGLFIQQRDLTILLAAKAILDNDQQMVILQ